MNRLLEIEDVSVAYGGLKALSNVTFAMQGPGVFGLIGPNGAGKSTCINVLTGFQPPAQGGIALDGVSLVGKSPVEFRHLGISRTFQAGRLFASLSVEDNVTAAGVGLGLSRRAAETETERLLKWTGISHMAERRSGDLPYTDQRRLSIARALVGNPNFLLLDEPAAGMSATEADELGRLIKSIAEQNVRVLLIEHNVPLVLSVCEHIAVLDGGRLIASGDPHAIRTNAIVREAYLGSKHEPEVTS
ncbi:ABC transporter ATP-binding protein [Pseudomonas sp. NPDC088444]|uniref:ABC transporter ATP-binding protein n=1 Tax=Pseudomonas sp. NPDC088444 TaxID=3364456 RepID=UPI00384B5D48